MSEIKFTDLLGQPIQWRRLELLLEVLKRGIEYNVTGNLVQATIQYETTGPPLTVLVLATGSAAELLARVVAELAAYQGSEMRAGPN